MTDPLKKSRLYKSYYRNGQHHRSGADVSFGDIVKIFGFKGATIGAWVNKEEQQIAANLFFDALCDLMCILEVPEQVIALNGTLSLAFGSGGHKHASAHYNSRTRTLALAKNAGAGALAHEWFHAFDHFIASKFIRAAKPNEFASELWLNHREFISHPLNACLQDCFQHIFLDATHTTELSTLFVNSAATDKRMGCFYYSMPQELCARAFEAFVQDSNIKNEFLVQGTKQSKEAKAGVYPQGDQRMLISSYFVRYFNTLGRAVKGQRT
ncbi:MAG: CLCA_X family protein [Glaciecola sp.]